MQLETSLSKPINQDYVLVRCDAVQFGRQVPTPGRNILSPLHHKKVILYPEGTLLVPVYKTMLCLTSEEHRLDTHCMRTSDVTKHQLMLCREI